MEENQKNESKSYPMCANHPIMKTVFIGILIFLGAFCAFYTVIDWHMKSLFNTPFERIPARMDKMIQKDMRRMDAMRLEDRKFSKHAAQVIHLEQAKNAYKVIIDLRAFDNNENNVQVSANGNILTINGRSIRKSKNNEQISEFQQNYMFGDNVKLKDLLKETSGNYYIITVPIGESEE